MKDIEHEVEANPDIFKVSEVINWVFGGNKKLFEIKGKYSPSIPEQQVEYINFVMEKTANMGFSEFIKYVYSTYPIYKTRKFQKLDLPALAQEYKTLT